MTKTSKEVQDILRNPPRKEVGCPRCGSTGIINCRGMIVSDPCPHCSTDRWHSSGKINAIDYEEFERVIRKAING